MEFWIFWVVMLGVLGFFCNIFLKEYGNIFDFWLYCVLIYFLFYVFVDILEFEGVGGNEIYEFVQFYLSFLIVLDVQYVNLCCLKNVFQNIFLFVFFEIVEDIFMGMKVWWKCFVYICQSIGI